jgi:magnesium chelatase family protein
VLTSKVVQKLESLTSAQLMREDHVAEPSADLRRRVVSARNAAAERWTPIGRKLNTDVPGVRLRDTVHRLPRDTTRRLTESIDHGTLSARGFDRVLRVAWSIADLDGRSHPDGTDVDEALFLRGGAA